MKGSGFTHLCAELSRLRDPFRADLHLHTHFSDGTHSPADLIARAKTARLGAIAITDHDTMAALNPLREFAGGLEVIAGVEITCGWRDRETHLLGYFVDPAHPGLLERLAWLRQGRRERALGLGRRFSTELPSVEAMVGELPECVALGRRHIARWLIAAKAAGSLHDAFARLLNRPEIREIPRRRLPLEEAISLVREAGGVCSFAHPPEDTTREQLTELAGMGLDAVEARYPWPSKSRGDRLLAWAGETGLLVTGGSDSHDATPPTRNVGARGINRAELDKLRALAATRRSGNPAASGTSREQPQPGAQNANTNH